VVKRICYEDCAADARKSADARETRIFANAINSLGFAAVPRAGHGGHSPGCRVVGAQDLIAPVRDENHLAIFRHLERVEQEAQSHRRARAVGVAGTTGGPGYGRDGKAAQIYATKARAIGNEGHGAVGGNGHGARTLESGLQTNTIGRGLDLDAPCNGCDLAAWQSDAPKDSIEGVRDDKRRAIPQQDAARGAIEPCERPLAIEEASG
jgi:hypothetical protein